MITICVNVEPYLAHYMYACHANCIREDAIKLSHRTNHQIPGDSLWCLYTGPLLRNGKLYRIGTELRP